MFSSSSGTRGRFTPALGLTFLGLIALLLTSGSAGAFEGIQGQYAIFYPSVELLYYHTDNLFLTPDQEEDSDTFIIRPKFRLEIPTDRHFFSLQYTPQYRDIDDVDLETDWSHFVDLEGSFQGSPLFRVELDGHFARGVLEVEEVDPDSEIVVGFDAFNSFNGGANFIWEGQRQGASLGFRFTETDFDRDEPTELEPQPAFLEESTIGAGVEYFYKFTPLSRFLVGYNFEASEEDFADTPTFDRNGNCTGGACLGVAELDSDANHVYFGFDGELGRTSTGAIRVGFRSREFDDIETSDFESLVVDGTFTKAFTRFTKMEINLHREDNFSNFENQAYYTANRISMALTNQPLGRRVFWTLAAGFQRNDYPNPVNSAGEMVSREDDIIMARAEVGYFPLTHLNLKLNYRFEDRDSNMPNRAFDYEENAIIFQLGLGF